MLVIATSIACATFNLLFLAAILGAAYGALWLLNYGLSFTQPRGCHGSLVLRMSEPAYRDNATRVAEIVDRDLPKAQIDSVALDDSTCLLTYIFPQLTPRCLRRCRARTSHRWLARIASLLVAGGCFVQAFGALQPIREKLQTTGFRLGDNEVTQLHFLLLERGMLDLGKRLTLPSTRVIALEVVGDGLPTT